MKRSARVGSSELSPSLRVRPQWCSNTCPSWKSSKAWPFATSGNAARSGSAMASAYVARTHELIRGGPRDPPRVRRADRDAGAAALIGRRERTTRLAAVLVNGAAGHPLDFERHPHRD